VADHVVVTGVNNPRSATPEKVEEAAKQSGAEITKAADFADAADRALLFTPKSGVLVITGSIYLVGESLEWLARQNHVKL
jgi:folylpolyglutamate synthase/dihydropteroate synthase